MLTQTEIYIIVGTVIGGIVVIAAIIAIVFCCLRRRRGNEYQPILQSYTPAHNPHIVAKARVYDQREKNATLLSTRLYLRSTAFTETVDEVVLYMGKRPHKHFYPVANHQSSDFILASTPKTAKSPVTATTKKQFVYILMSLRHPYIDTPITADFLADSDQVVVIRRLYKKGSIRDEIYGCKPLQTYADKYQKLPGKPLKTSHISRYGRMILEALLYLEKCGLSFPFLQPGNVMVDSGNGACYLTDLENIFLKIERHYEYLFREFNSLYRTEAAVADLQVLALGAVLFEMTTGIQMQSIKDVDMLHPETSPDLRAIMLRIFRPQGVVPSLQELALETFFMVDDKRYTFPAIDPPHYKYLEADMIKSVTKINAQLWWPDEEKARIEQMTYSGVKPVKSGGSRVSTPTKKIKSTTLNSPDVSSSPKTPSSSLKASTPTPKSVTVKSKPKPSPQPTPVKMEPPSDPGDRSSLLSSISGFNAKGLKKTTTRDRSAPRL